MNYQYNSNVDNGLRWMEKPYCWTVMGSDRHEDPLRTSHRRHASSSWKIG